MAGTSHDSSSHEHFQHAPDQSLLEKQLNTGLTAAERYSKQILVVVLALVVVGVAYLFWQRSGKSQNSAAWTSFMECKSPEDYLAVAEKHAGSSVGEWARLEAGKLFISEGLSQSLTNREASDASLKNAQKAYETLLNKKTSPELRQEALYGLATCLEALSDGNNKPATEAYEALLKEYPNTPHKLWAESRISELKSGNSQSFYAWFRQQNPKPADRPGPRDIPALDSLAPELNLPDVTEGTPPNASEKTLEIPAKGEMPALPAAPAPEAPAGADQPAPAAKPEMPAKPAESKPAAEVKPESKPAEVKPAETKPAAETKPDAKPAPEAKTEAKPAAAPESKPADPPAVPEAK